MNYTLMERDPIQQTLFYVEPKWKKHNDAYQTWKRQSQVTLPPKYKYLLTCMKIAEEISRSAAIRLMIKDYFEKLPEDQKQQYIRLAKEKLDEGKF